MTALSTAEQGVRTWLKAAKSLTDAQVILADKGGVRPPKPYLSIKVLTDTGVGGTQNIGGTSGSDATLKQRKDRRATISIQGHGVDTHEWLVESELKLSDPSIQDALRTACVSIIAGSVRSLPITRDTATEARFGLDVEVAYGIETTPTTQVYADKTTVSTTLDDTFDASFEVSLP